MYGLEDEDLQPQAAMEDAEIDESDAWCAAGGGARRLLSGGAGWL